MMNKSAKLSGDAFPETAREASQRQKAEQVDASRILSVDEIARRVHVALGQRQKGYYARQIRGWAQRGLMDHVLLTGVGRTAGRMFDVDAPFRACLLSHLTALGMGPEQMRPMVYTMDDVEGEVSAYDRLRSGEQLYLSVDFDKAGEPFRSQIVTDPTPFAEQRMPAAIVVDLQFLLGPIVKIEQEARRSEGRSD